MFIFNLKSFQDVSFPLSLIRHQVEGKADFGYPSKLDLEELVDLNAGDKVSVSSGSDMKIVSVVLNDEPCKRLRVGTIDAFVTVEYMEVENIV